MARSVRKIESIAKALRDDLEMNRLEVVLIPSRDPECAMRGGMVRAVQSANPYWYSEFCESFASARRRNRRKFDTKIKRAHTLRALAELSQGRQQSEYAKRIAGFIQEHQPVPSFEKSL